MAPEVLIVGDASRRVDLLARIVGLGYEVAMCTRAVLEQRIDRADVPGALVVCTEDVDPRALMTALRATRRGSGVPVTLYGPLGGGSGDLADVLDLGADHFLEAPATDDALAAALDELLGPSGRPAAGTGSGSLASGPRLAASSGGRDEADTDVVMGQLHRTLDILEARLRDSDGVDAEELDLDALGVPALPEVDEGSARTGSASDGLELPVPREDAMPAGASPVAKGSAPARRDRTERLGQAEGRRGGTGSRPAVTDEGSRRRPPLPLEDRGSLDRVEVPRLLWTLHRARYTGALLLAQGRVEKRLWWRDGDIVSAASNVGHDRLIDGLLRRGLLTRDHYASARRLASHEPGPTGAQLVEAGLLKPSELPRVLRAHFIRIIDSTFPWTEGRWMLAPGEAEAEPGLVDTTVALVVAQGVRHRMESGLLLARLGGLDQHPRFRAEASPPGGPRGLAERLLMSDSEEALLLRLDGTLPLRELLAGPQTDELELLGLVYALHVLDQLELGAQAGVEAVAADPVALDVARIRDRLQVAREGDYFAALGLSRDAAWLEVRHAHAELQRTFADASLEAAVRQTHRAELEELRDLLDEARDVLADEGLRSAYLAHLEEP